MQSCLYFPMLHVLMFPIILKFQCIMYPCPHVPMSLGPRVPVSQCPCVTMSLIPHAPYLYILMFPYSQVSPNVLCPHVLKSTSVYDLVQVLGMYTTYVRTPEILHQPPLRKFSCVNHNVGRLMQHKSRLLLTH